METEPITIKVQYIRDLKTKNAVEFNKKLETFEIITGISFDVAGLLPRDLTMLLELEPQMEETIRSGRVLIINYWALL